MKTFNKRGDRGETSLLYGARVPKSHAQCEAYGTVDEAVSALGLARALTRKKRVRETVLGIQRELFTVAAELATGTGQRHKLEANHQIVTGEMVQRLEDLIDELEGETPMPQAFIIPGASPASATLDMARTIVRRAERRAVSLKNEGIIQNEAVLQYLNRLADLLFTLARHEERDSAH